MQQIMLGQVALVGCTMAFFCLCPARKCIAHEAAEQTYVAPAIIDVNRCRPAYPRDALLRSEQGVVKLEFTIGVKGRLIGSRIVKSSGFRELDTAALTALMHCSFQPAYRNGLPVQAAFTIDYTWKFGDATGP